jgi:hypothetical protein
LRNGSPQEPERKVTEEQHIEETPNEFERQDEQVGEIESADPGTTCNPYWGEQPPNENEATALKLAYMLHDRLHPQWMASSIEFMRMMVESAERHLEDCGYRIPFRMLIAREMYSYYTAIEQVARAAKKVEKLTGFPVQIIDKD